MRSHPRRGDIWRVDFGRQIGHEQGADLRPAVVVSSDGFNDAGAGLAIVAPLTRTQRDYPSRVKVRAGSSGLRETSWAAVEHMRSVSVLRLREYMGGVEPGALNQIDRVLRLLLLD